MLFPGKFAPSLVSDAFNDMCVEQRVEARVQASPNPGDPFRAMRLVTLKNFNTVNVKVTQQNKRKQVHILLPKGELQIMLKPDEDLPIVEKENNG